MTGNQVYELLNNVASQAFGESAPTITDLQGVISLGDTVLSSETNTDAFLSTLMDRIGKTVIRRLNLSVDFKNLIRDSFEFGAILQKVTIEPLSAKPSEPWKIGGDSYTPNQFAINKPTIRQSLFSNVNVWSVKVTITDVLFTSAFTSEQAMASFIDGIISAMNDTMTNDVNNLNRYCVNNFIGEKLHSDRNVIHLLTEYNTLFSPSTDVTLATSLYTPEFLRYTSKRMGDIVRYMSRPSILFNEESLVRETKKDNMHIFLNGEFASATSVYLQSDTFHKELVSLPLFESVALWQSMVEEDSVSGDVATMPSFEESTTINITTASGEDVEQSGVIGAFIDRQAVGTTIYRPRVTTDRNNDGEYTNYSSKCDLGLYNDLSENGVIFVLD